MHSDNHFIAAILANPFNNDLRTVYADWLEEQRDPRAELLRITDQLRQLDVLNRWELEARMQHLAYVENVPPVGPFLRNNAIGMEFVLIPGGHFLMGTSNEEQGFRNNERQHAVTLSHPFFLGVTQVTQQHWTKVMSTKPWSGQDGVLDDPDCPAICISWENALRFCKRMNERNDGFVPLGWEYVLPTEAQWEYACRAGSSTAYSFGDGDGPEKYAWFVENTADIDEAFAHRVGQKHPNAFGLYDMHGNVWEWCRDWYGDYPRQGVTDPTGPAAGRDRVTRGGSWYSTIDECRSARRGANLPFCGEAIQGFRVAIAPLSLAHTYDLHLHGESDEIKAIPSPSDN